ncbi:MAG: DUF1653 domain-containing protein [Candidatus Colwellbacteria bacterium]|nr:DUF1653 domain-containing protein [Candidatus Colwellbacteria bacterium]
MEIKPGIYCHFKGGEYKVIGMARHSETLEDMVIYCHSDDKDLWVRPASMFEEEVEKDGKIFKRFTWLREQ